MDASETEKPPIIQTAAAPSRPVFRLPGVSTVWRLALVAMVVACAAGIAFTLGRRSTAGGMFAESNEARYARLKAARERAALDADEARVKEKKAIAAQQRIERVSLARAALQRLLDDASSVLKLADDGEHEIAAWNERVTSLLANDAGKAIAANPTYVTAFMLLMEEKRPDKQEIDAARGRIHTLIKPIEEALTLEDPSIYTPSETLKQQLIDEGKGLADFHERYQQARTKVEAMSDAATKRTERTPHTLAETIQAMRQQRADAQARAIAEAEEAAQKKVNADLAQARADKLLVEGNGKVAQLDAEKEAERLAMEAKTRETHEAAEKERRIKLAQSAEVKALLAPFLAEGYFQPRGVANRVTLVGDKMTTKTPMSLSRLKSSGALEPTDWGLYVLYMIANGSDNRDPDRPHWGMPGHFNDLSSEQLERAKKTQETLRDLGDTLLELKMLAP